jgi:UDP-2,3-diacylglucosamine hydrolase
MDHCLFISDLHLCDSRPHITQAFIAFLESTAAKAQALYILGDLFEYWAGDDAILADATGHKHSNSGLQASIHALHSLTLKGVPIFLMHGNRDFLLGQGFEKATGVRILPDPSLITLFGRPVLLSHGDALCKDDVAYQQFRAEVRSKTWRTQFLNKPLSNRVAYIEQLRSKSEQAKSSKSMQIMDVNLAAVDSLLQDFKCPPIFIHGHTHRPNNHLHHIDGNACERWVLGDWYEQGSYLKLDVNGCQSQKLEIE